MRALRSATQLDAGDAQRRRGYQLQPRFLYGLAAIAADAVRPRLDLIHCRLHVIEVLLDILLE